MGKKFIFYYISNNGGYLLIFISVLMDGFLQRTFFLEGGGEQNITVSTFKKERKKCGKNTQKCPYFCVLGKAQVDFFLHHLILDNLKVFKFQLY